MKTTKIIAIVLAMMSATQVFGIRTDGGRNSRLDEGYWERGELPWGDYFTKCHDCRLDIYKAEQTLVCESCGDNPKYVTFFTKPFQNCPQDGWNELTVIEDPAGKVGTGLACVNTRNGKVINVGSVFTDRPVKK